MSSYSERHCTVPLACQPAACYLKVIGARRRRRATLYVGHRRRRGGRRDKTCWAMGDRDTLACRSVRASARLRDKEAWGGGWEENRWIIKVGDGQVEVEEGGLRRRRGGEGASTL